MNIFALLTILIPLTSSDLTISFSLVEDEHQIIGMVVKLHWFVDDDRLSLKLNIPVTELPHSPLDFEIFTIEMVLPRLKEAIKKFNHDRLTTTNPT